MTDVSAAHEERRRLEEHLLIQPGDPVSLNAYGVLLSEMGEPEAALTALREATRIELRHPDPAINLSNLLVHIERPWEGVTVLENLNRRLPGDEKVLLALGKLLDSLGELNRAQGCFAEILNRNPVQPKAASSFLYNSLYFPELTPTAVRDAHRNWGFAAAATAKPWPVAIRDRNPERRLRIGYVNGDCRQHSNLHFIPPLLRAHDLGEVELFLYHTSKIEDDQTPVFKGLVEHWRDMAAVPLEAFCKRVEDDAIDILVDASGHTRDNRLDVFATKPAPVQLTWLSHPNAVGLPTFDARITDYRADPPGLAEALAIEPLIRVEPSQFCFEPPVRSPAPGTDLRDRPFTFGTLNNPNKMGKPVIQAWAAILRQVPESRLVLKVRAIRGHRLREKFENAFADCGVPVRRLVILEAQTAQADHLLDYQGLDLSLDTFPFNGITTTFEALWMGVPVLGLRGDRPCARMASAILEPLDLGHWVAPHLDAYVEMAVAAAKGSGVFSLRGAALRERLVTSKLCDGAHFAREMEKVYRTLWRRWCEQA